MDIREKFGTAWIGTSGTSPSGASGAILPDVRLSDVRLSAPNDAPSPSGIRDAYLTVGKQVVLFLEQSNGVDRLHSLADRMKVGTQDLVPVVEWLAKNYYLRVETEQFGNHEIRLTDRAKELTASSDRPADVAAMI